MYLRATKRGRVVIGTLLAAAVLLAGHAGSAWKQVKTKAADAPVAWETSCFQYSLHEDGLPGLDFVDLQDIVRASFDAWEDEACTYFYFLETEPAETRDLEFNPESANVNLLLWLTEEEEWPHDPSAVALTHVAADPQTGRIFDADVEFNSGNIQFGTTDEYSPVSELIDLQSTVTHEIGHMIGLDHTLDLEATMYGEGDPGSTGKRTLEADDIAGLCTIYPGDADPDDCPEPICGLGLSDTDVECYLGNPLDTGDNGDDCSCSTPGSRTSTNRHWLARLIGTALSAAAASLFG